MARLFRVKSCLKLMILDMKNDLRTSKYSVVSTVSICYFLMISVCYAEDNNKTSVDEAYIFDQALLKDSGISPQLLKQLSEGQQIAAGQYRLDLYINQQLVERTQIEYKANKNNKLSPCFNREQLAKTNIIISGLDTASVANECVFLEDYIPDAKFDFDFNKLKLNLIIPNLYIKQNPRGYVEKKDWDAGSSIGFINYMANYYLNNYEISGKNHQQSSTYIALNGGINFAQWQFRQQSSVNLDEHTSSWNNIKSYVKRPLENIQSELSIGQLNTSGRFFSGLNYLGINLRSDERMLPESMRGYAPVVQGIAKTTARVSIKQNNREIYQSTVAPGAFRIEDLFPTSLNGDLDVYIYEADGSVGHFKVPFSAVPDSLRQGAYKYDINIGKTREYTEDAYFANIDTQYGLNNTFTLNSGLRLAKGYQAAVVGTAFNHYFGALGTDFTYTNAKLSDQSYQSGWMINTTYSKTFVPTQTTIALAGYRFSSSGYQDLSEILNNDHEKQDIQSNQQNASYINQEKSRVVLSINQNMDQWGTLYLSSSLHHYRDQKNKDYQLQLGYGKSFKNGISMNFSIVKQQSHPAETNRIETDQEIPLDKYHKNNDTQYAVSFTFPFNQKTKRINDLTVNYSNNISNTYQASISGILSERQAIHYNLGLNYDDATHQNTLNFGAQKRFAYANLGLNASSSENYWQSSANIQGAMAFHRGGITLGHYLSDTFALIEAPGAKGAQVLNAQNTKIDRFGFALVPTLTPYRFNALVINPIGSSSQIEFEENDQKVAPYAGATVKVKFNTKKGYAMLLHATPDSGENLPLGADVFDEYSQNIGVVGQNNQIYIRSEKTTGSLNVKWGNQIQDSCHIDYQLSKEQINAPLIKLDTVCKRGHLE